MVYYKRDDFGFPIHELERTYLAKNIHQGISWRYTEYKFNAYLLVGEQVLTIVLCTKRVRLNWTFIVYDVQNTTYSSHGAPCAVRDLFPWLNTRVKVRISIWKIPEYPKRHSLYSRIRGIPSYNCIVNFPLLSGDVPRLPSYGIYISQLVRFARCTLQNFWHRVTDIIA